MYIKLFLALFILAASLHAARAERIVIGGIQVPPYIHNNEDGDATGIIVEQIRIALAGSGFEPEFRLTNWARAYHDIQNGKTDALIPTLRTTERAKFLVFPETPLAILRMSLFQKKGSGFIFDDMFEEMKGLYVGKIRNASVTPTFDASAKQGLFILKERGSFGQLALGVARGRLDLMAGDELMSLWAAAENGVLADIEPAGPTMAHVPVYLALSRQSPIADKADLIATRLLNAQNSPDYDTALASYSRLLRQDIYERLRKQFGQSLEP